MPFSPRLRLPVYLSLSVSPGMTRLKKTPVIDVRAAGRERFSIPGHLIIADMIIIRGES